MTIDQFDKTAFTAGMRAEYGGEIYDLVTVDFQEKLIGIDVYEDENDLKWVRCENVKLILP